MIHIDIKKLGKFNQIGHRITGDRTGQSNSRGVGWEFVHVCIDDASRVAFSKIMKTSARPAPWPSSRPPSPTTKASASPSLRVMTDNGSCYRSRAFAKACRRLKPQAHPNKTLHPATNGKAERFIQTSLARMGLCPRLSQLQAARPELPFFIHRYNWHRPHGSIGAKPPISRLGLTTDNLLKDFLLQLAAVLELV